MVHGGRVPLMLLGLLLALPAIGAQLGPKDGAELPATDLERVRAGTIAPDFTLESSDGATISLSDAKGQQHVVLVFYRGRW